MNGELPPDIELCILEAKTHMTVLDARDGEDYREARKVKNARFERDPLLIAYCKRAEDAKFWFDAAKKYPSLVRYPIVVRSGGHQHEGRSVDSGAVVLDLSRMRMVSVDKKAGIAWIDSGAPLGEVNEKLDAEGYVLPVGGCSHVCAGGLTQGGGWGLSWRTLGMTIDKLIQVEIVTPDGEIRMVDADHDGDLFWALRGGGGGNFGVVTRLCFDLTHKPPEGVCEIKLLWRKKDRAAVAEKWTELMAEGDHRLNSFCRLTVVDEEPERCQDNPAVIVGGQFYGSEEDCRKALHDLIHCRKPCYDAIGGNKSVHEVARAFNGVVDDQSEELLPHAFALQVGAPDEAGPKTTCDARAERHKISSAYPLEGGAGAVLEQIEAGLSTSKELPGTSLYVSLHGMGGRGSIEPLEPKDKTAYPWRSKTFMVQIQAWWNGDQSDQERLDWVACFRDAIEGCTEGAFISFPDEDQDGGDRAKQLVRYYGSSLGKLQEVKGRYDRKERLRFAMSIPPG